MQPEIREITKNPNQIKEAIQQLNQEEIDLLSFDWEGIWARDKQLLPPGNWFVWLLMCGRGFGKTRTGSETIRIWKDQVPIIHLVGETAADARDVMIEGESGILSVSPNHDRPLYEPSKRRITWKNGAIANVFSAEDPEQLRGPHCYKAWADELAKWRYPDAWDQLVLGAQLGENPQIIVTTTPRPTDLIKNLIEEKDTHLTVGTTYENRSNLSKKFLEKIIKRYEGTRLGDQELLAKILEDIEGALWNMALIEKNRVSKAPVMKRIVIAIDPAVTSKKSSDETGIVVCGLGVDNMGYVLEDISGRYTPNGWAKKAINAYYDWKGDRIIGEVNNGGDMIENTLRGLDDSIPYKSVHATRGKIIRAEPIVAMYERDEIKHVGIHEGLETQMTTWNATEGEKSPDRVDALVWGFTELKLNVKETNVWI